MSEYFHSFKDTLANAFNILVLVFKILILHYLQLITVEETLFFKDLQKLLFLVSLISRH